MSTNTYYSPFFPEVTVAGTKGSTIAAVPSAVVEGIKTDVGGIKEDIVETVDKLAQLDADTAAANLAIAAAQQEIDDLVDTYGSTANAAASAQAAQIAKAAAEAARDLSQGARDAAQTAQGLAAGSAAAANTAKGLAETAKGQAETAKTNAETARNAAQAAQGLAEGASAAALISKNDAKTFSESAASSATTASGHAGTASTAAGVASSSSLAAQRAAQAGFPTTFEDQNLYFSGDSTQTNTPATWVNEGGRSVFRMPAGNTVVAVSWRQAVPSRQGVWRVRALVGNSSGNISSAQLRIGTYTQADASTSPRVAIAGTIDKATPANSYVWIENDFDLSAFNFGTGVFLRPEIVLGAGVGASSTVVRVAALELIDVSSEKAALGSANAAAGSATTASTKAGEAASSASSANVSFTNAQTEAGKAATSAGQASTSATNALGSANAASTSASVSAQSAGAATGAAKALFPERINNTAAVFGKFDNGAGSPTATPALVDADFVTDSDFGTCVQRTVATGVGGVGFLEVIPLVTGRIYRLEVEAKLFALSGWTNAALGVNIRHLNADYSASPLAATVLNYPNPTNTMSMGVVKKVVWYIGIGVEPVLPVSDTGAGRQIITAGAPWGRVYSRVEPNGTSGSFTCRWSRLQVLDVTDSQAALGGATAAEKAALLAIPSTFEDNTKYFTYAGNAGAQPVVEVDATAGGTIVRNTVATGYISVASLSTRPTATGRKYKVRARVKSTPAGGGVLLRLFGYNAADRVGGSVSLRDTQINGLVDDWQWVEAIADTPAVGSFVSFGAYPNFASYNQTANQAIVRISALTIEDVTSQVAAETSATAASTSASTAATQAGAAGTSASAANTAKTNAETAAGNANTYATQSSTSAKAALLASPVSRAEPTQFTANASSAGAPEIKADYPAGLTTIVNGETALVVSVSQEYIGWKKVVPLLADRTYRFTMDLEPLGAGTSNITLYPRLVNSTHTTVNAPLSVGFNAPVGRSTVVREMTFTAAQVAGYAWLRPAIKSNAADGGFRIFSFACEDVTSENSASMSAGVSATSATAAGTSATIAQNGAQQNIIGVPYLTETSTTNTPWPNGNFTAGGDSPPGMTRVAVLRNVGGDLTYGPMVPGNWNNRTYRFTGWVKAPQLNMGCGVGLIGRNVADTASGAIYPIIDSQITAANTWTAFTVTFTTANTFSTARPFVRSTSPYGALWTDLILTDITESAAAAGSASAAATSASTAGTKATEAGTSAGAAQSSATTATTAAGTATTQATNASNSATTALGHANNASASATVSATSANNATLTVANGPILPSDFSDDGKYWSNALSGLPTRSSLAAVPSSSYVFETVSGAGRVVTLTTTTTQRDLAPLGWFAAQAGRRYRINLRYRHTSAAGAGNLYLIWMTDAGNQSGANHSMVVPFNASWNTLTLETTTDPQAGTAYVRPAMRLGTNATIQVSILSIEDITSEKAALGSANAAAGSATTASTKAGEAGVSASAAQAAQTLAETARGQAQTSASNASASEISAAGSSSSALTQAGVSASSAQTAIQTAASLFPDNFNQKGTFWSRATDGQYPAQPAEGAANSYPTDPTYGTVYQMVGPGTSYGARFATASAFMPIAGRRYRAAALVRITSIGTATGNINVQMAQRRLSATYGFINDYASGARAGLVTATTTDWTIVSQECDGTDLLAFANVANCRPYLSIVGTLSGGATNAFDGTLQVAYFKFTDITSETAALGSANAAASSATTAGTKATEAGVSAGAAETARANAVTARGEAISARDTAVTSATTATGGATTATTQAGIATTAASAAIATVANGPILPSTFDEDGKYWTNGTWLNPPNTRLSLVVPPPAGYSFVTVTGVGKVLQLLRQNGNCDISPLGWVPWVAGRTFRVTARVRAITGAPNLQLYCIGLDAAGAQLGTPNVVRAPGTAWEDMVVTVNSVTTNTAYLRPLFRFLSTSPAGATAQVAYILIEDITAVTAAQNFATAASGSASAAQSSVTDAGAQATIATQQKDLAIAANGTAQAAATNAQGYATAADASRALASSFATLSSSFQAQALNMNPFFADPTWTVTTSVPPSWVLWGNTGSAYQGKWSGDTGNLYSGRAAFRMARPATASASNGISQVTAIGGAGWYVLEADVTSLSGNWLGAGVLINATGFDARISFGVDPDLSGAIISGASATNRKFSKLVQLTSAPPSSSVNLYAMSSWSNFSTAANAGDFVWHKCLIRPATRAEIDGKDALAATVSQGATITTQGQTISTLNSDVGTLKTTVTAQGVTIGQSTTAISTLNSSVGTLQTTVGTQGASLTSQGSAITSLDSRMASVETRVTSSGNANLVRNGSFERGDTAFWYATGMSLNVNNIVNSAWGTYASSPTAVPNGGYAYIDGDNIYIETTSPYTLTADIGFFITGGTGTCYVEMVWYTAAGAVISLNGSPTPQASGFNFDETGQRRQQVKVTATPPSNAATVRPRVVWYKGSGTVQSMHVRQIKLERGSVATPYSGEASAALAMQSINGLFARAALRLDVNGYVTGFEMNNNGTSGDFNINADYFRILKPGGGSRTEYSDGNWRVYNGSGTLKVRMGVW